MRYPLRLISSRPRGALARALAEAGVDPHGVAIIERKAETVVVRVDRVAAPVANIIKQQLLSMGGDAAVHREAITGGPPQSSVYIIADRARLARLPEKLAHQPFGLAELGAGIERLLGATERPPSSVPLPGGSIDLAGGPVVAGVLNVTPDSFSDGGAYLDPGAARERSLEMIEEGARVIDVGGESTRPGAAELSAEAELARVMPVLRALGGAVSVPLSIDTRHAAVARAAIDAGASIVNDVSGLRHDAAMIDAARESGAAVVVMHMLGTPETMQANPSYEDVTGEIISWFEERTAELVRAGIAREKIIIDPGIGFGKRFEDNLALLNELGDFTGLGYPVMVGYSRKSFLGKITGRDPSGRLSGGLAALAKCLAGGASFIRVHDVAATVDFLKVWNMIEGGEGGR
jgi:dihydropteroate synthase